MTVQTFLIEPKGDLQSRLALYEPLSDRGLTAGVPVRMYASEKSNGSPLANHSSIIHYNNFHKTRFRGKVGKGIVIETYLITIPLPTFPLNLVL